MIQPVYKVGTLNSTPLYDTYWRFAYERQEIFYRRLLGVPAPWTTDPILQTYKFTNCYRVTDRVSQYLVRNVLYNPRATVESLEDHVFRTLFFKLFNKTDTWQRIEAYHLQRGEQLTRATANWKEYDRILSSVIETGGTIYSQAYMMTGRKVFGYPRKHQNHLALLQKMLAEDLPARIVASSGLRAAYLLLLGYPLISTFLAYQYVIDINYSLATNFSESAFVVAGPGAVRGIHKCFGDLTPLSPEDVIRLVADRQETEFRRRRLKFQWLGSRQLQLIDIQNLFCELDKYSRVMPDTASLGYNTKGRQPKQRFRPTQEPIEYVFPPKWNLYL